MTRPLLALAAALLSGAAPAKPAAPALPPGVMGDVHVTADHVSYEAATGRVLLDGKAVVRRGPIVLRASRAEYDPATSEVRAFGGVLLTDPTRVVSADTIRAVIGGDFEAQGVIAFVKDQRVDLSQVASAEEAGRIGRNRLSFSSPRVRGTPDGHLKVANVKLTLCDCPRGAPPSWEITAEDADIVPGERAILTWPVLRITPPFASGTIPVFVFPWLYMPLSDRQTGFLIPVVGSTGSSGFSIAQPFFLTLGRSADATLTPEYAFGRDRSQFQDGKPSVRGPGARLELRWAPAPGALGRAELAWLHDLDAEPGGQSGNRGALELTHGQRFGDATSFRAGIHLAGDSVWVRDTTSDLLVRALPYKRSDVLVSHRRDALVGEAVASYDQPLDPVAVGTAEPWGTLGSSRGVASRLGAASASLVPTFAGPVLLSGRLGAARFAPIHGLGPQGLDVAGRPGVTRADARAEVSLPLVLGGALGLDPYVRAAGLAYGPEAGGTSGVGWTVVGATFQSEVSRRFGEVRHVISPHLEWRAGTRSVGEPLGVRAYDHFDLSRVGDLSATPGPFSQLRAEIETRVETAKTTAFRAYLGQDADLRAGRLAEMFAGLGFNVGPVTGDSGIRWFPTGRGVSVPPARIPSGLDEFTELRASLGLRDARGDSLSGGFVSVGPGGSGTLLAGLDPIFDVRAAPVDASGSATVAARAVLGSARLGYDALFPGRATFVPACNSSGGERRVSAFQVQQHSGSLTYESACHCFRLIVSARITDCGDHGYSVTLDLGRAATGTPSGTVSR